MRWPMGLALGVVLACSDTTDETTDTATDSENTDTDASDTPSMTADSTPPVPCPDGDPTVSVGNGSSPVDFVVVNDGDIAALLNGPQGGWHVDIGAAVSNAESIVEANAWVIVDGQQQFTTVSPPQVTVANYDDSDCSGVVTSASLRAEFDEALTPEGMGVAAYLCGLVDDETPVEIGVRVQNFDGGEEASSSATVTLSALGVVACATPPTPTSDSGTTGGTP